jgi:hypothetical protein
MELGIAVYVTKRLRSVTIDHRLDQLGVWEVENSSRAST